MSKQSDFQADLEALRNLIDEAHQIMDTVELPQGRSVACRDLLSTSLKLANDLLTRSPNPASEFGRKGGSVTAQRGSEYFREIAGKRKNRAGGRPRKGLPDQTKKQ
jgi:hypothetical protein